MGDFDNIDAKLAYIIDFILRCTVSNNVAYILVSSDGAFGRDAVMTNFAIIDPGGDDLPTEMRQLVVLR